MSSFPAKFSIRFLILCLLAGLSLLCGCKDQNSGGEYLLRRITLSNTPEDVAEEIMHCRLQGNVKRILVLSSPEVRQKLVNEFALTNPDVTFDSALNAFSEHLKLHYYIADESVCFSMLPPETEEDGNFSSCTIRAVICFPGKRQRKEEIFFRMIRDRYGNWKNDTRL